MFIERTVAVRVSGEKRDEDQKAVFANVPARRPRCWVNVLWLRLLSPPSDNSIACTLPSPHSCRSPGCKLLNIKHFIPTNLLSR